MAEGLQQVPAAVGALYGSNPAMQAEANTWLTQFSSTPGAWDVVNLLDVGQTQEVQYFCANLLLGKVRSEWVRLSDEQKGQMNAALSGRLQAYTAQPGAPALVLARLSLVLGAAASLSSPDFAGHFLGNALHLAANAGGNMVNVQTSIDLLSGFAEELDQVDRAHRQSVIGLIGQNIKDVMALVEAVVTGQFGAGVSQGLQKTSVKCLGSWLKLDPTGSGGGLLTPGQFMQGHASLYSALLGALAADHEDVLSAVVEVLVEVLSPGGGGGADPAAEEAAVNAAVAGVLAQRGRCTDVESEELPRGLCRIAVALAERATEMVASGQGEMLNLVALMLDCASRHQRPVAEHALEFFLMLSTVPMAQRHPQLQHPLHTQLLQALFSQARYPEGFTTWEECTEDDTDSFHRFREQVLADALDSTYGVLRAQFLSLCGQALQGAASWREAEVAVFAVRAVAITVKARVLTERASELANQGLVQDKQDTSAFLQQLFAKVAADEGGRFSSHPMLIESTARLIGAYAQWFGRAGSHAPLEGSLRYLLSSLQVPQAWRHGANSFRNLCARCCHQLKSRQALEGLLESAERAISPPAAGSGAAGMEFEERAAVVEGLARVAAQLGPADASQVGQRLVAPLVARAQQLGGAGLTGAGAPAALAAELRLIASAVRFLEFPGDGASGQPHPAMNLLELAWPAMGAVAEAAHWRGEGVVVEALCEVFTRALLCCKGGAAPLLNTLLSSVLGIFESHQHPPCLDTLSVVFEVFGASPELQATLSGALGSACNSTLALLGRGDPSQHPDLLAGFFGLAHRASLYAPDILLRSPVLPLLFQTAVGTLGHSDRGSVREALVMLTYLLAPGEKAAAMPVWQQSRGAVDACVQQHGEHLLRALMVAAAGSCPRELLGKLGGTLYALIQGYHGATQQWIVGVLAAADYPGNADGILREEDKRVFCESALRQPALPRPKFEALVQDFAFICRREGTGDTLLAYQM